MVRLTSRHERAARGTSVGTASSCSDLDWSSSDEYEWVPQTIVYRDGNRQRSPLGPRDGRTPWEEEGGYLTVQRRPTVVESNVVRTVAYLRSWSSSGMID